MSRDITNAVNTESAKSAVEPVLFVFLDFDTPVYLWSGVGDKTWDSQTWKGVGDLGKVSPAKETESIQAEGLTFELSGIPSALIFTALTDNYQGEAAAMWLGFLSSGSVIADPVQIFSGRMDTMEISEQGETSTIIVSAESRLADLLKTREWRYTHEDQQIDYPGDLGLEFVTALQDKEILWGPY